MPLLNRLKEYRSRLGVNQTEMGKLAGVSRQTISQIERGDYSPSVTLALKIAKICEVSVEDIFIYEEEINDEGKEKKSSYFTATWKMLAAVIIGGIAGGVSVVIYELMKKGIDAGIRTINGTIQQYIFSALIIIAVVTVVVGEYSLYRLKNVYKEMKDADEDRFYELDYEEEKWGAWTSGVNLVSQVACIIILSFGYSLKYIESGKSRYFLFACIIFILCYFYDIYLSVRYVKAIQAAHPEKKGDPTSSKFTEQWVESCDEAEKEIIYKSAYKTYIVLNKVIPILLLLTLIANMFLNTGILAVLVVAVIYLVTGMTYIRSSMVSKAKRIG